MAMLNNQMVYTYGVWKKSCTTKRMVETLEIMGFFMDFLPPFSTGAGFRNHPQ